MKNKDKYMKNMKKETLTLSPTKYWKLAKIRDEIDRLLREYEESEILIRDWEIDKLKDLFKKLFGYQ